MSSQPFTTSTHVVLLFLLLILSSIYGATVNKNCALIVPENPLTLKGLITPYLLRALNPADGDCLMSNPDQQAFVEGVIFVPSTGQLFVYNPLVISESSTAPAIPPTPLKSLPSDAVVGLWFGTNADTLTLLAKNNVSLSQGNCVNGLGNGDVFGQFAACNAKEFFHALKTSKAYQQGKLVPPLPPLGTAKDGKPCMTVRDFGLVDMDQSDNVVTSYLLTKDGKTAQNTEANVKALGTRTSVTTIVNGSDNRLLSISLDQALGCTPYKVPDLANNGTLAAALALNEIQATLQQKPPVALIPRGNPMVRTSGDKASLKKLNLYREAVFQPHAPSMSFASTRLYCFHFGLVGTFRILLDKPFTVNATSPNPDVANNLFTFLAQRFANSWKGLKCDMLLDIDSPIALVTNANGVTTDAKLDINALSDSSLIEIDQYMNDTDTRAVSTSSGNTFGKNVTFVWPLLCLVITILGIVNFL